nr:hypothetical protein [Nocardia seriolae]
MDSAGVLKELAEGDAGAVVSVALHQVRDPVGDGVVEGKLAFGCQLEDDDGDKGFGGAGHAEVAVGGDGAAGGQVGGAAGGDQFPAVGQDYAGLDAADTEGVDGLGVLA